MKRSIGKNEFEAVVIGCSAGGTAVLSEILPALHESFPLPVMIVQHISAAADDLLVRLLRESCRIAVKEAEDGEDIQPEVVYLAPANYHLLVEK
ncbi:MAG: chemotaxis protein CheB, partial [Proteobacteria bacterium]|nr:chemotaxis protein CheB [Pseudomonadota bacterium]